MFFRSAALLTTIAIPVGLAAQDLTEHPSPNLPPGFSAPELAGRYLRGSSHDYGSPSLGVAYQYESPLAPRDSSFGTLYLYQRGEDDRRLTADSLLALSAAVFKEGLETMRRRGDYDEYHVTSEGPDTVTVSQGWKIPGYRVAYTYHRKSVSALSFFYLYVAGNTLLKVRATTTASRASTTDLPDFAHEVVELSARKAPHT